MVDMARFYSVVVAAAIFTLVASAPQGAQHTRPGVLKTTVQSENKIPETARAILEQPDQFELLSLDPAHRKKIVKPNFHGYKVLGTTLVKDAETRKELVTAFESGVVENQGLEMFCFNPRHGIRVTRDGKNVDFVICFECLEVQVYGDARGYFLVSGTPQRVFDKALRDANVSLGRRSESRRRHQGGPIFPI